jgi:phytoene desaturase
MKNVIVVGGGISGLSAASYLSKYGFKVKILEKNQYFGGRIRKLVEDGFTFDMGPSWYWMPEIFENFFNDFNRTSSDYYSLTRLDPSYKVFWEDDTESEIPADYNQLKELFESIEEGSSIELDNYLSDAKIKYEVGMGEFVMKPSLSATEYLELDLLKNIMKLDLLKSISSSIQSKFKNKKLRQLLEFPVLFLGAKPSDTPSLYSMMNYADIKLGTWYPDGGMYKIAEAFEEIAKENGVELIKNSEVESVEIIDNNIHSIKTNDKLFSADIVVNASDYHHFDQNILPNNYSSYTDSYWDNRIFAPTCVLFYIGVNKKIQNFEHHNLFFDTDFDRHSEAIYKTNEWPREPLFYASLTSKSDNTAPDGKENLFILVPLSTNVKTDENEINRIFDYTIKKIENRTKTSILDAIEYKKTFTREDFISDYNSFKGNAYGLANTLLQTGFLKPKMKSKKINNLYNCGQLTVPGPGLPPSILSGKIVADLIKKEVS